jgi:hypothetical protein
MKTAIRLSMMCVWVCCGIAAGAFAQEPAGDPPSSSPPAVPPRSDSPAPPAGGAVPPPPADDVFIPSEEVQADEELAFPVDI